MTDHFEEFPFEEIRTSDGDFFSSWHRLQKLGYADNQIWSVALHENTWTYGPPHHYVNVIGFIATNERHDMNTYYHEELEEEDDVSSDNEPS